MRVLLATLIVVLAGCTAGERSGSVNSEPAVSDEAAVAGAAMSQPRCVSSAVSASAPVLARLQDELPKWLEDADVPSAAVSYIRDGAVGWTLVCGERSPGRDADLSTLYNTASIAKPIVGEVVLRLVDQGLVSLDEPMAAHWVDPDIADDPRRLALTPRIALAHSTGFANWRRLSGGTLGFRWQPGTQRGYSGEGIRYLVRFLEEKLDVPFEDTARRVLFEPAGVADASFVGEPWFGERVAWRKLADGAWAEPTINREPLGAGDLWISSADYARLIVAVLNDTAISEALAAEREAIFSDEVSRHCGPDKTPVAVCPAQMGFGIGWYVYRYPEHTLLAHSGSNRGEKTLALFVPELEIGLVIFTNGENGNAVVSKLARALYDNERFMTLEGY